jgi:hypothetical protein
MIKENISKLLDTEMERKDFLKLIGIGAVAAVGVSGILKAMSQPTSKKTSQHPANAGYGSMAYGGTKDPRA